MNSLPCSAPSRPARQGRSPRSTILAGIVGLLPLACLAAAVAAFAVLVAGSNRLSAEEAEFLSGGPMPGPPDAFYAFAALMVASAATTIVALVYFMIDAFMSPHVAHESRILWAAVLLLGNSVAFPVYWYVAWWRRRAR
jgi:hypothetical protein